MLRRRDEMKLKSKLVHVSFCRTSYGFATSVAFLRACRKVAMEDGGATERKSRRRTRVDYKLLDQGAPELEDSLPCSPPQLEEQQWSERRVQRAWRPRGAERATAPAAAASAGGSFAAPGTTSVALLVMQPWASLLATGAKTWELRGRRTHKRGRVALVASRTGGFVVGGATLVACHGPLSAAQLAASQALHRVPAAATVGRRYKEVWAWEFADGCKLAVPLRYDHPPGAVIWVNLAEPIAV